ncbi:MAG: hypothetical protein A2X36_09095 [Elusimicrobia bacterium GWA2_69_24]|nr:MAG: hypothetical protein A2X36_09095 [Elusimicrobia bacterium GWA2_69_24]HBL18562.1 hypothetical protein [Elusimicrobiota bacterium]
MSRAIAAALSLSLACACGRPHAPAEGMPGLSPLVLTELPSPPPADPLAAVRGDLDARYPAGTRIILKETDRSRLLSAGLSAAGGPAVSPDALRVLFAGKESPDGRWAIYESPLRGLPRRVADLGQDCADPAYISGGRVVFSCRVPGGGWALHTASLEPDGAGVRRISFGADDAADPFPLPDGRILFALLTGSGGLFTVNPDGTGVEAFAGLHGPRSGERAVQRPRPTGDGGVLFLSAAHGRSLHRVEMSRPMAARASLADGYRDVSSAEPLPDGSILLAADGGVYRLRPGGGPEPLPAGAAVYEAVPLVPSGPRKGRPSAVVMSMSTGTLLCVDADLSDGVTGPRRGAPRAARVEFLAAGPGESGALGGSPVEEDGSFLVDVPADRPLRVRTVDRQGRAIAVSGPLWVRPGEVRSCTGCHEGHERMAPNRPLRALTHDPRPLRPGTRESPP